MTTPPPKPVSEPIKPAVNEPIQTSKENSRMFKVRSSCLPMLSKDGDLGNPPLNFSKFSALGCLLIVSQSW